MLDPCDGCAYSLEDLLGLVAVLGAGPVRDLGLLDSACHRPRSGIFGRQAYPTLAGKAAALLPDEASAPAGSGPPSATEPGHDVIPRT